MDRAPGTLAALFARLTGAPETLEQPQWRRHFESRGVDGAFVLHEPLRGRRLVYGGARARKGHLPHATFEIAAALVGLESGAMQDEREVFRWDGRPKPVPLWERDHDLVSAMAFNVVWMFQEVARRTGRARMREWLERLAYGNRDLAGGVDLFWLQGGLRISALEQAEFLHRLAEGSLPATQRAQRLVRGALLLERSPGYALYGKTGTSSRAVGDPVWWWVGWVERRGRVEASFALDMAPARESRFADRFDVGRAILQEAGALPGAAPVAGGERVPRAP